MTRILILATFTFNTASVMAIDMGECKGRLMSSTSIQASPADQLTDEQVMAIARSDKMDQPIKVLYSEGGNLSRVFPVIFSVNTRATKAQIERIYGFAVNGLGWPAEAPTSDFSAKLTLKQIAFLSASDAVTLIGCNGALKHADSPDEASGCQEISP